VVKQKRNYHRPYNAQRIRAVLTETLTTRRRDNLIEAAKENVVSPVLNPLFWFASSEELTRPAPHGKKTLPRYLVEPHVMITNIWKSCVDDKPLNLSA
jgi:hypothetical protein